MRERETIHQRVIELLRRDYPGSQTNGFRRAVQRLKWDFEEWSKSEESFTWKDFLDFGEAWKGGILPDLWLIDEQCMSVVCFEVEDTSRINSSKIGQYEDLWWHLDNFYWEIHLIVSDRWGNLTPVPLTDFTEMALANSSKHHLNEVIEAELDAKKVTFDLTKIYSIRDQKKRAEDRLEWIRKNPGFEKEQFLINRARRRAQSLNGDAQTMPATIEEPEDAG